jgi:hypothetical protein
LTSAIVKAAQEALKMDAHEERHGGRRSFGWYGRACRGARRFIRRLSRWSARRPDDAYLEHD